MQATQRHFHRQRIGGVNAEVPFDFERTFESYADTTALRAATADFMNGAEDLNLGSIFLETSVVLGGYTKAMRYDFVNQGDASVSVGRGIAVSPTQKEIWVEIYAATNAVYTTVDADPQHAHKLWFAQFTPDLNGRFSLTWGHGGTGNDIVTEHPKLNNDPTEVTTAYDARIHWNAGYRRHRLHWKCATDASSSDGVVEVWFEDDKPVTRTGLNFGVNGTIQAILLGRNKDGGVVSGTESFYIGRVRWWYTDPRW